MILIADSGSTKCHWASIDDENDIRISTDGINPFHCDRHTIESIVDSQLIDRIPQHKITEIHFFGAGCRDDKTTIIADILRHRFPQATIEVTNDLKGAAIALFGDNGGIACILGTGSVACLYDGKEIVRSIDPLGYILGDEGSGAVLGRKLLGDCFKNRLPQHLKEKFFERYPTLTASELIERVYRKPLPNRFLASFAPFLSENIEESYAYNLVFDSFTEFFERNIASFDRWDEHETSFCGSVAYHFADVLEVAAAEFGIRLGQIVQSPIDNLALYFKKYRESRG